MHGQADGSIRSLVSRYAHAVVSRDGDAWSETWATNGRWEILGQAPVGRAAVRAHWEKLMSGIHFVFQLAGEGSIEVEESGKRATGRFPTVEFLKFAPEGPGNLMIGTYRDVYIVEEGEWRFESRRIDVQYMGPADLSAASAPAVKR